MSNSFLKLLKNNFQTFRCFKFFKDLTYNGYIFSERGFLNLQYKLIY